MPAEGARVAWITRIGLVLIVGAAVALVTYVRLRLAGIPLERDEGEYAYAGQLILHGTPPYALAYNMKFPGTYYAYAALMSVFGQTAWGIRVGLLAVNSASIALVFALCRRLAGTLAAGAAAAVFAVLTIDRWSMGPFAHATHFVLLPSLAGLWLLDRALHGGRSWQFVVAGALMGLAIVMKQQALPIALMAIALAAWPAEAPPEAKAAKAGRVALVIAGVVATLILMLVVLAVAGVLGRFWFWTFQYAAAYVSEVPLSLAGAVFQMAWAYITQATGWIWYTAVVGLVLLLLTRWPAATRRFVLLWLLASAAAVVPGYFFRPHYFILLMPVAAMLVGIAVSSIDRGLGQMMGALSGRIASLAMIGGLVAIYVLGQSHYLFRMGETELIRALYVENPFLESPEIGRYLAAHTAPTDRIAVLGSEPQIYFYANRRSATGYIYTYPLIEPQPYAQRMATEFKQEVEAARPAYIVLSGVRASWGLRPGSDVQTLKWAGEYAQRCYDLAGIADINPQGDASIRWDAAAIGFKPQNESQVMIYRRKPGACGG